jgi:FKBP-type peptidyl-prolyl cis-trans isomerase FkpA
LTPIVPAAQRVCAMRTPTGLGYTILRAATGPKPPADATVLVNYIGYLNATGAVFDQAMQTPMPVGAVIPGFSQGLRMLSRGGVIRLCIPATLGYGAQASGPIPANSDLVFQVELLDFKTAAEIAEMRKAAPGNDAAAPKP